MIDRGQAVGIAFGALLLRSVFRRNKQEHGASSPREPSDPSRANYLNRNSAHQDKSITFSSSLATSLSSPPQVDFAPGLRAAWSAFALLSFSIMLAALQGWWSMCALLFAVTLINLLSLFHQHQWKLQLTQAEHHFQPPRDSPTSQPTFDPRLTGVWVKVGGAGVMDEAIRVMQLNGLIKIAVSLVRGLELKVGDEFFDMAVFSVVSWFKVRERYALNGEGSMHNRRDLRRGKHTGHVSPLPDGGLLMQLKWEGNFGGHGEDRFQLEGPMLVVRSMLVMNGITVRYVQSYRRKE